MRTVVALLLSTVFAFPLSERSLVIERFEVRVRVDRDGSIVVTETIHPRFEGRWNGIFRTIPIEYRSLDGFNKTFFLELDSITDEDGNDLDYESSREQHYRKFKIWVPGAEDTTRTVKITYRIPNALLYFEDHDELYWNFTGDEWDIPIETVLAEVQLPAGAAGIETRVYTGPYGSRKSNADVVTDGNRVTFKMRDALSPREGMTGVVGWNKGLVQEPSRIQEASYFLRSNWPLFVPIVVFLIMWWLWHTRGRDPRQLPIAVKYAPPEGMTPAEIGTLIDNTPNMRDITATIVDLAVRGHVLIEEDEENRRLGWSDTEYVFHKRTPTKQGRALKPHEEELLNALFASGTKVQLSNLKNKFYEYVPFIKDCIYDELMKRRYYDHRPDNVKATYIVVALLLGFLGIVGGGILSETLGIQMQSFVLAGVLSAASIAGFGWFMPARTVTGVRALEGVLGFEEFLGRVEADRFARMVKTPELFEKFLPFAMALGVEKQWVEAFEDICKTPPEWYRGGGVTGFRASSFVHEVNRMTTAAASAMASSPRSSGSSGFSSGGSSGGGGGGGGGGGF
ncbi:MAG: DUF2207 domain-containing protein [Acidobacteria bacterium]|nr:DUF2207 domain-containing protein [Acidobacteriota bacterium]